MIQCISMLCSVLVLQRFAEFAANHAGFSTKELIQGFTRSQSPSQVLQRNQNNTQNRIKSFESNIALLSSLKHLKLISFIPQEVTKQYETMWNMTLRLWKTLAAWSRYDQYWKAMRKCNESNTNGASQADNEIHQWVSDNLLKSTPKWLKDRIPNFGKTDFSKDLETIATSVWLLGKHIGPNGFVGILHSLFWEEVKKANQHLNGKGKHRLHHGPSLLMNVTHSFKHPRTVYWTQEKNFGAPSVKIVKASRNLVGPWVHWTFCHPFLFYI